MLRVPWTALLSTSMADVRPFRALHYDPERVDLGDVTAPPYDVSTGRPRGLVERSTHASSSICRSPRRRLSIPTSPPPISKLEGRGVLERTFRGRSGALEDYTTRATRRTPRASSRASRYRVRSGLVRLLAHHPARIMIAGSPGDSTTLADLRPPLRDAWQHVASPRRCPVLRGDDAAAPSTAPGRSTTPTSRAVLPARWPRVLIADGHHRYETARTYAEEIGGEGDHRFVLACLVSLEDPGLSVFATNRLLHDLSRAQQESLRDTMLDLFHVEEVDESALVPDREHGTIAFGTWLVHPALPAPLRAPTSAEAMPVSSELFEPSPAAWSPDLKARCESTDAIAAKRGIHTAPPSTTVRRVPSGGRRRLLPSPPRSSWCARSPTPARRCRRSPRTSSRSCSPASPSTLSLRLRPACPPPRRPRADRPSRAPGRVALTSRAFRALRAAWPLG